MLLISAFIPMESYYKSKSMTLDFKRQNFTKIKGIVKRKLKGKHRIAMGEGGV